MDIKADAVDGHKVPEPAHQIPHLDHHLIAVDGGRRHRCGRGAALGISLLSQQHHKAIFQTRRHGFHLRRAQQRPHLLQRRILLQHKAHTAGLRHRIDDPLAGIQQPDLQLTGRHGGGETGLKTALRSSGVEFLRRAIRQPLPLMKDTDLITLLRLIQIGGTDHHTELFLLDQLLDDLPQLPPRQGIDANGGFIQQQQLR